MREISSLIRNAVFVAAALLAGLTAGSAAARDVEAFGLRWTVEAGSGSLTEGPHYLVATRGGAEVLRREMYGPGTLQKVELDGQRGSGSEVVYTDSPTGSSGVAGGMVIYTSATEGHWVTFNPIGGVRFEDLDGDGVSEIMASSGVVSEYSTCNADRPFVRQILSWKDRRLTDVTDRFPTVLAPEIAAAEKEATRLSAGDPCRDEDTATQLSGATAQIAYYYLVLGDRQGAIERWNAHNTCRSGSSEVADIEAAILAYRASGPEDAVRAYYTLMGLGYPKLAYPLYKVGNRSYDSWKSIFVDPVGCVGLQSATLLSVSGDTGKVQVDVCVHDRDEGVIHRWQGPVTMTRQSAGRWVMTAKKLERAGRCQTGCVP